jgi:lysylphosphatidylglycerol synthetase-like protein (DUF2156 family)
MNQANNHKNAKRNRGERDWWLTLICLILAAVISLGIYTSWKYLQHDINLIFAMIPASAVVVFLLLSAGNGRRHVMRDTLRGLVESIWYWG